MNKEVIEAIAFERGGAAFSAAIGTGATYAESVVIDSRARSEALYGLRTDQNPQGAGTFSIGERPDGSLVVGIRSYTGKMIYPLGEGIESSSTLD